MRYSYEKRRRGGRRYSKGGKFRRNQFRLDFSQFEEFAEELDGLPPIKMHCSNLAADGLQAAIENYKENNQ